MSANKRDFDARAPPSASKQHVSQFHQMSPLALFSLFAPPGSPLPPRSARANLEMIKSVLPLSHSFVPTCCVWRRKARFCSGRFFSEKVGAKGILQRDTPAFWLGGCTNHCQCGTVHKFYLSIEAMVQVDWKSDWNDTAFEIISAFAGRSKKKKKPSFIAREKFLFPHAN